MKNDTVHKYTKPANPFSPWVVAHIDKLVECLVESETEQVHTPTYRDMLKSHFIGFVAQLAELFKANDELPYEDFVEKATIALFQKILMRSVLTSND